MSMTMKESELSGFEAAREKVRGMKAYAHYLIANREDDAFQFAVANGESSLTVGAPSAAEYWFTVAVFIEEIQAR